MYKIYIKNYKNAASPTEESVFDSSEVQYTDSDRTVLDPVVKKELNKAGSFEFTVLPGNRFYDRIKIVKTVFSVFIDDTMIFRGRVMSMSDDIYKQRQVYCEGELAYLNDSLQPPKKEVNTTVENYLSDMLSDHNNQMDLFSSLTIGGVPVIDPNEDNKHIQLGIVNVTQQGLSYRTTDDSGEVVITDENGNYTVPGTDTTITWALGGIDNAGANDSNQFRIRMSNAVYVRARSVVVPISGYRCSVVMYSAYTDENVYTLSDISPLSTESYTIENDCHVRIVLAKAEDDDEPFSQGDQDTVPDQAVNTKGLTIVTTTLHNTSVVATPFNSTSYRTTFDAIESDLINIYGGYINLRYANGQRYLDYTMSPPNGTGSQKLIEFGVNLQEVTAETNAEDLYSVLLPTGDSNLLIQKSETGKTISNKQSLYVRPTGALQEYGPIFKTQSFSGISTRDELEHYANNYIAKTYRGAATAYTLKTVDMHFVDESHPLIVEGSRCRITLWPNNVISDRICTGVTYELQAPENSEHVFEALPYEREGLTSKYVKEKTGSSRGGGGGRSASNGLSATADQDGAGSQDMILRSNGNIMLYPGEGKSVSIPLAQSFLAPMLKEWILGNVSYDSETGLKVEHDEGIEKDLFVRGKVSVGTDQHKGSYGSGTVYAQHQVRTDGHMKSPIYWLRPGQSSGNGETQITYSGKSNVPNTFMPCTLQMSLYDDELVKMWVIGDVDVNFNIADTQFFKDCIGVKEATMPNETDNQNTYVNWNKNTGLVFTRGNMYGLIEVVPKDEHADKFYIGVNAYPVYNYGWDTGYGSATISGLDIVKDGTGAHANDLRARVYFKGAYHYGPWYTP